eukprot:g3729.t1
MASVLFFQKFLSPFPFRLLQKNNWRNVHAKAVAGIVKHRWKRNPRRNLSRPNLWSRFYELARDNPSQINDRLCAEIVEHGCIETTEADDFVFKVLPKVGLNPEIRTFNALLKRVVIEKGDFQFAKKIVKEWIPRLGCEPDIYTDLWYNIDDRELSRLRTKRLMAWVQQSDAASVNAAWHMFNGLVERREAQTHHFGVMLKLCASVQEAKNLVEEILPSIGLKPSTSLLKAYETELQIYGVPGKGTKKKCDIDTIRASRMNNWFRQGKTEASWQLLETLVETNDVTTAQFTIVLKDCRDSYESRLILGLMRKAGCTPNTVALTTLIHTLLIEGNESGALQVLKEEMPALGLSPGYHITKMLNNLHECKVKESLEKRRSTVLYRWVNGSLASRKAAIQLLEKLERKNLAVRVHYKIVIDGIVRHGTNKSDSKAASWNVVDSPEALKIYRRISSEDSLTRRKTKLDDFLDDDKMSQYIYLHGATRGIAIVKVTDILLKMRNQLLSKFETFKKPEKLPWLKIVVGRGRNSGTGRNTETSITTQMSSDPVLRTEMENFLHYSTKPSLLEKENEHNDNGKVQSSVIYIRPRNLWNWVISEQAEQWEKAIDV